MADINWPVGLRPSIKASKSREEVVGFRESPVTSGPSFIEPFSEDTPVFYNVEFIFNKNESRAFQSWLRVNRMKTNAPFFDFPILIEDPNTSTQEARFTLNGYPQLRSETNAIFTYSARILIRKIIAADEPNDAFILQLSELTGYMPESWMSDFDRVINTVRT